MAYELIETIEVGAGGAASIEFTSIPQDGVDLLLVASARNTLTSDLLGIHFNGTSGFTNYSGLKLRGDGASVTTSTGDVNYAGAINHSSTTASTFSNASWLISNYASTQATSISVDTVVEYNTSSSTYLWQAINAMNWSVTDPITSLSLTPLVGTIAQYSTASLYKIY